MLAAIWFFSLLGEEKRDGKRRLKRGVESSHLRRDLALVWRSRPMRFFLVYLIFSMMFAFLQDTVLEPFAGQVFGMEAQATNRFSAYWGGMAILGSFGFLYLSRRYRALTNSLMSVCRRLASDGCLLAVRAVFPGRNPRFCHAGLDLARLGFGHLEYRHAGFDDGFKPRRPRRRLPRLLDAGRYLRARFWRGGRRHYCGIWRCSFPAIIAVAYGTVFVAGCLGLALALLALRRAKLRDFALRPPEPEVLFAGALD